MVVRYLAHVAQASERVVVMLWVGGRALDVERGGSSTVCLTIPGMEQRVHR